MDFDRSAVESLNQWSELKIRHLESCGFQREHIILDSGIGFGKSAYQNLFLLQHVEQLKQFGCEVMVGHSRKRFISSFSHAEARDRDLETVAVSLALAEQGVDYLRVHHVRNHQRALVAYQLSVNR